MAFFDKQTFLQGLQLETTGTAPVPSAATRGQVWVARGGAGVEDVAQVVIKDLNDNYVWRNVSQPLYTTTPITLYVDPVAGLDTNDGLTAGTAVQRLMTALLRVPFVVNHDVLINVAAGTLIDTAIDIPPFITLGGNVTILGAIANFTPATGLASGTFDATFGAQPLVQTAVVTGAGWTPDNLRNGVFVQVTSGLHTGVLLPIMTNTASTLDVVVPSTTVSSGGVNLQGQTFQLVTMATIVPQTGSSPLVTIRESSGRLVSQSFTSGGLDPVGTTNRSIVFRRLSFIRTAGSSQTVVMQNGSAFFVDCAFLDRTTGSGNLMLISQYSTAAFARTLFSTTNTATGGISTASNSTLTFGAVGFDKTNVGLGVSTSLCTINNPVYFLDCSASCITMLAYSQCSISGPVVAKNSPVALAALGGSRITYGGNLNGNIANATKLLNCTVGVRVGGPSGTVSSAPAQFFLTNPIANGFLIDGCTTGVELGVGGLFLVSATANAWAIQNCTGWGVQMVPSVSVGNGFNMFQSNTGLSMSGNVSGDFALNGVTNTSLATLRAASPKLLTDANYFNRLVEV